MRKFDYLFLQNLPLPENILSLRTSIDSLSSGFHQRKERRGTRYAVIPSIEALLETGDSSGLSSGSILHINSLIAPASSYVGDTQRQQVDAAVSAYTFAINSGVATMLAIPCLTMDICCISPFTSHTEDTAMALAQVLLYSSGYDMCRYCSLLDTMYQYRFFFNRALSRSSAHWKEGANEYAIFIEQFLSLLYMGLKTVRPRKKQKSPPAGQKPTKRARIEALVLDSAEPISKADICAALPDISPTTIEAVLGTLVKAGAIQRIGAARASRYIRT